MAQTDYMPDDERQEQGMDGEADGATKPSEAPESETFLIPKSALGGREVNPGDECTFRVVKCYEDECEVEYVSEGKDQSKGSKSAMDESMDGMDSMVSTPA